MGPTVFLGNRIAIFLFTAHCVQVSPQPVSLGSRSVAYDTKWSVVSWTVQLRNGASDLPASKHPRVGRLGTPSLPAPSHSSPAGLSGQASFHLHGYPGTPPLLIPENPIHQQLFSSRTQVMGQGCVHGAFFSMPRRGVSPWFLPRFLASSYWSLFASPACLSRQSLL